jgi:hypothetical protein
MVHLPLYLKLDDDYAGAARIFKILAELYGFSTQLPEIEMGEKQYDQVSPAMTDNPALKDMVERFERETDAAARKKMSLIRIVLDLFPVAIYHYPPRSNNSCVISQRVRTTTTLTVVKHAE